MLICSSKARTSLIVLAFFFVWGVILLGIIIVAKKVISVLIDIDFQLNNFKIQNTSKHLTFYIESNTI